MSVSEVKHLVIEFFRTGNTSDVIMAGDTVTRLSDGAIGVVEFVGDSPYWGETAERAYVVFNHGAAGISTDYLLSSEIEKA